MKLLSAFRAALLLLGLLAVSGEAHAACVSPAGGEGEMLYASNINQMVFCNGADWIAMGGSSGGGGGASALSGLSDVNTSGAGIGSILSYNGSSWVVSSTAAAGMSALASLTDVTLTNLAGRDYLRYDSVSSRWVNISESTVMSTTTMVSGAPDAIICVLSGVDEPLYLTGSVGGNVYYRRLMNNGGDGWIQYTVATGAYVNHSGMGSFDCVTGSLTLNQLYASGRAFNFIGNAAGGGGTALGDRITSGTLAMVANSATSYISLSTNGTTWGYFNSVLSYLPAIATGRVSATNISGTLIQVGNGNGSTCDAGRKGAIRYSDTSSSVQFCNGTGWTSLASGTTSSLAALSDVSASTPVDNQILRYNASQTKWEAVSASDAVFSCPSGYALVSAAGRAYGCIKTTENAAAACATHINSCRAEGARLATLSEFKMAQAQYGYTVANYAFLENAAGDNDCAGITSAGRPYGIGDTGNYPARCFIPAVGIINSTSDALGDRITSGTTSAIASEDSSLTISTAGAQRMVVGSNGAVGIGTATPGKPLDVVKGLLGSDIVRIRNQDGADYSNLSLGINDSTGLAFLQTSKGGAGSVLPLVMYVGTNRAINISPSGFVGISRTVPLATLDVAGTISASDAIQLGQNTIACGTQVSGSIRYNTTSNTVQFCNGSGWVSLASGTTGGGASALAGLSDVNLTNLAGRDYLRYDAGTSRWVNISESSVMSTTTMVNGWPDSIICNVTNPSWGPTAFYPAIMPYTGGDSLYHYRANIQSGAIYAVRYNSSGAFASYAGITTTDCNTSISSLYASGKAFNFIGNAASGSGVLGDRITSGTHTVAVNTSSGYVSLSTSGTNWGYFSSGASYLPTLVAARVSSTNVSATTVHINGNVGIGTTSPGAQLGIVGANSASLVYLVGGSGGVSDSAFYNVQGRARFGYDGVRSAVLIDDKNTGGVAASKNIVFDTDGIERMRVARSSGYVGIGTASPINSLHVSGSSWTGVTIEARTNDPALQLTSDGSSTNNDWTMRMDVSEGDNLQWRYDNTAKVTIDVSGSVGIGSTAPKAKLDVVGTISASDAIQVGTSSATCGASIPGAIRYNAGSLQYCNASAWTNLVSGTGGGGVGGSGSANHIAFWSDASTLTYDSSQLYWDATNNRLGIGNTTPSTTLYVNGQIGGGFGAMATSGVLDFNDVSNARSGNGYTLLRGSTAANAPNTNAYYWQTLNFEYGASKLGDGNITQMAIPYSATTSIDNGMYLRGRYNGTWSGWYRFIISDPSGNATVANNMTAAAFLYSSDKRLKENIVPLTGGLAKLDAIIPVTFNFISDTTHTSRLGVIAQEIEKVYPQAVVTGSDGYKKVDYPSLVPVLIQAVKELKAANDDERAEREKLQQIVDSYRTLQRSQVTEHGLMLEQLLELKAANDNLMRRIDALEVRKAVVR